MGTASCPRKTILVVEDDHAVRNMLETALRHYGFRVRPAGGGDEAVAVYERHRDTIDLVLLDVQMPRVDGPHTLARLQSMNPDVPCVFMSGHTGEYTAEQLLALGAAAVLAKPFPDLGQLIDLLREVMP